MKRLIVLAILAIGMEGACRAAPALQEQGTASPGASNAPLCLVMDLSDGSRVVGIFRLSSLPLTTSYAKMNIPLKQVLRMKVHEDRSTVWLEFLNGDKLQGTPAVTVFDIEAIFGKTSISLDRVTSVAVLDSGIGPNQLEKGLVLHYAFDAPGDTLPNKAADKNPGAISGARHTPDGLRNGAFEFNGRGDFINAGHDQSLDITRDLTISVWFKKQPKTFGAPHQLQAIVGKDDGSDQTGRSFMLYRCDESVGNNVAFSYGVASGGVDGRYDTIATNQPLADGQWHHVLVVHETGVGNRLYVDGTCQTENQEGSPLPSTPNTDLVVGDTKAWEPWFFYGALDELRIYSRALSPSEVNLLHRLRQ